MKAGGVKKERKSEFGGAEKREKTSRRDTYD